MLVLANLKARNLGGFKSHGMVLCASNDDHTQVRAHDMSSVGSAEATPRLHKHAAAFVRSPCLEGSREWQASDVGRACGLGASILTYQVGPSVCGYGQVKFVDVPASAKVRV